MGAIPIINQNGVDASHRNAIAEPAGNRGRSNRESALSQIPGEVIRIFPRHQRQTDWRTAPLAFEISRNKRRTLFERHMDVAPIAGGNAHYFID